MAKVIVLSPLDESYLGDEFRLHPLHLGHLLGRDAAAPVGGLAARKVREWAASGLKRFQLGRGLTRDCVRPMRAMAATSQPSWCVRGDNSRAIAR
jgi:hypothetical protein